MKYLKINIAYLILSVLVLSSCNKLSDFGDTNLDPNRSLVASTPALLSNVLTVISNRTVNLNGAYYAQYMAETQYPGNSIYILPKIDYDGIMAGPLYDCQKIIDLNTDPKTASIVTGNNFINGTNANQIAVARILRAYYFWTITDIWGDVPYSEALKFPNTTPKFDKQEAIYKGLITDLKAAALQFDGGKAAAGDFAYEGDVAKWKRLANSLRLLMALRMSKVYPGSADYAAIEFKAALSSPGGVMTSNADNFKITYPGGAYPNPWFGQYTGGRKDLGESEPFVNLLLSLNDARQNKLVYGTSNIGVPFGRNRTYMLNVWGPVFDADKWSRVLGAGFRADNSPVALIHSSMLYFARAEAKELGWTSPADDALSTQTAYEAGIKASYDQWGLTTSDYSAYVGGSNVAFGTNNLYKIRLQRYIAIYPDGLQGWSEWRRTGVPTLTPALDALNSGQIPRRYTYGPNDYNTNTANTNAAVSGITGGDIETARVWWDKL